MRRWLRLGGTLLIVGSALTLAWAVVVWQWQDPFTAVYTKWEQDRLSAQLDRRMRAFHPQEHASSLAAIRVEVAREAAAYRRHLHPGEAIGRLTIAALGLRIVLVQGTDHESLKKGPGHYAGSALPGQNRLVYIAGHRTTYLAPFSHIDDLKRGDAITIALPYASFDYVVTRHRIVAADDVSVLRSPRHEVLILQACHPRFFATHRYLVYATPVAVTPRGGASHALTGSERVALGR